jgi:hypothetical protein
MPCRKNVPPVRRRRIAMMFKNTLILSPKKIEGLYTLQITSHNGSRFADLPAVQLPAKLGEL